jgi:hypothetical protein
MPGNHKTTCPPRTAGHRAKCGCRTRPIGLRVFNVGITRAKKRLYLIGNRIAVRGTERGPLPAIHNLSAGEVRVVRARKILADGRLH